MPYKMLKFKLTGQVDTPAPELSSEQKNSKGKHSNHGQTFDFSARKNEAAFDLSKLVGGGADTTGAAKAAKEAMRAEQDAINDLIDSDERLAALQQSLWDESRALVEAAWTPLQNYSSDLDHLNILFSTGNMKVDEYNSVIDGLNIKLAETNATVGAFETALDGIFDQAISGGDDFEKQLRSIGKTLATDIFKENVFNPLKDAGKGIVGSLLGGGKKKDGPAAAMDLLGGGSGDVSSVFDKFLGGLESIFGQGDKGFLGGLTELFTGDKGVISGFGTILSESWTFLSGLFTSFLTEMGIMQAWEIAEKWALAIWDTAERWAIAIFEAAAGFLGFETGGEITVTRPTLFVAGEKNKAEHIRVSPLSGGSRGESRGGRGGFAGLADSGGGSGGVTNVQVFIPQTSVISGLTEGSFARKITNAVGRQRARTV
jgi:hypothetical protein